MLRLLPILAVLWLLLTGAASGKALHTAEPPLGNFLLNLSEASSPDALKTQAGIRESEPFGYECMPGDAYCHNDPVNKVDVLGLFEVVTSDAHGNEVGINSNAMFWMVHQLMFPFEADPNDPFSALMPRTTVPFGEAVQVAQALGGAVKHYNKAYPMFSTMESSPYDLWVLPQLESFAGGGRGYGDSSLVRATQQTLGVIGDVVDYRVLTGVSESNAAYPWGSLSGNEMSFAVGHNSVFGFWDLPLATNSSGNLATFASPFNQFRPMPRPGESYGMRMIPLIGSMREFRNGVAIEAATLGAGKGVSSLARLGSLSRGVTVYRVEGMANARVLIGEGGNVAIQGEQMLFLNFGNRARAEAFLSQRLAQGMDGVGIRQFQVPRSFLDDLRRSAVPESMARSFPDRPIIVDPTKAADQFGLRLHQIEQLERIIIPGSGR